MATCPGCGETNVMVNYSNPLSYECRGCGKTWSDPEGIMVIDAASVLRDVMNTRLGLGQTVFDMLVGASNADADRVLRQYDLLKQAGLV